MDIFNFFIGRIDPKLESQLTSIKNLGRVGKKKRAGSRMTLLSPWKQGHPKCRCSHVVSSQPWYLEVRQKRCTHIREAIFLE
jgi:hypothetical protein